MYASHATPKRRHSSLFERMENQIKKISKKLSAAKESYRDSSVRNYHGNKKVRSFPVTDARKKEEDFINSYNSIDEQTVVATARNHGNYNPRNIPSYSRKVRNARAASTIVDQKVQVDPQEIHEEETYLEDTSYQKNIQDNAGKVIKGLSTMPLKKRPHNSNNYSTMKPQSFQLPSDNNSLKLILKLQDQNSNLSFKLGRMSSMCETQSFKVGQLKAELRQTSRQLNRVRERQQKQNCYLVTLLQHYKQKATKYKKALRRNSEVSIDLQSSQGQ